MPAFLIHKPKCVFIHIAKTGGSSIRNLYFDGKYDGPVHNHFPSEWMSYFKFAFVRNPFDRVVSAWKMFSEGMDNPNWSFPRDGHRGIGLRPFLEIVIDDRIGYQPENRTYIQRIRNHMIPFTHPYSMAQHADFIGRFENLKSDFAKICQRLGLSNHELGHRNKTERGPFQNYYDDTTQKIVREFFANDFERFGYDPQLELVKAA